MKEKIKSSSIATAILVIIVVTISTSASAAERLVLASDDTEETVEAIQELVEDRAAKREELIAARRAFVATSDEIEKEDLRESVVTLRAELAEIDAEIKLLATGIDEEDYDLDGRKKIDLKEEAERLVQPFVIMLRSATEKARQIENLRRALNVATSHRELAEDILSRVDPLLSGASDAAVVEELTAIKTEWSERLDSAEDLMNASQRQLDLALAEDGTDIGAANEMARSFLRDRGLNLLKGLLVFLAIFLLLRFIGNAIRSYRADRGMRKSLATRIVALVFAVGSVLLALVGMLITFNMLNDWLLVGLTVLFLLGIVWVGIGMIPSLIEQIALYLNLGAVQEGERVFFDGIPWLVKKLDFYSDLYNPALDAGQFTVPIRELIGLHSRPVAEDEPWFPTLRGDFVRLEEGLAQVLVQTPGVVEVEIEGGIRKTYPAAAFFEMAPENLSRGSRAEVVFGISYRHQPISTGEVRDKLREFVRKGLLEVLSEDQIRRVDVETLQANDSSIDYEVECDLTPDAAVHYETVERLLTRLCIDACNHYGWEIPFPQLVVHRNSEAVA